MEHHVVTLGTDDEPGPLGAYISIVGCTQEQAREIVLALRRYRWACIYTGADAERVLGRPGMRCVQAITITAGEAS